MRVFFVLSRGPKVSGFSRSRVCFRSALFVHSRSFRLCARSWDLAEFVLRGTTKVLMYLVWIVVIAILPLSVCALGTDLADLLQGLFAVLSDVLCVSRRSVC